MGLVAIMTVYTDGAEPEVGVHMFETDRKMSAEELREELAAVAEAQVPEGDEPPLHWNEFFDDLYSQLATGGPIPEALAVRGIRVADWEGMDWAEVYGEEVAV